MRVLPTALLFTSIASRTFGFRNPSLLQRSSGIINRGLTMQNSDILNMNVGELENIITSDLKDNYQIVDVREPNELEMVSLPECGVVNLPLGTSEDWAPQVAEGKMLDKTKPTICVCHHGMRSKRVATFLVDNAGFEEVYNLTGGVHSYATQVDDSIGTY